MNETFSPKAIGLARILYFGIVLAAVPIETISRFSTLPSQITCIETSGVRFDIWLNVASADILSWVFRISTAFAMIGFLKRYSYWIVLFSLCTLSVNALKLCYFNHQTLPLHVGIFFWALFDTKSDFSVDSWLHKTNAQSDGADGAWLVHSMRAYFCIVFFLSGVAKLRGGGLPWMFGDTLRNMLIVQNFAHEGFWPSTSFVVFNGIIVSYPWISSTAAFLRVISEVTAPLAFFKTWLRPWLVLQLAVFQIMIYFTMYINFAPWAAMYVFFLPLEKMSNGVDRAIAILTKPRKRFISPQPIK